MVPLWAISLLEPYQSEIASDRRMQVCPDRRRGRRQALNVVIRACFCRRRVSLSIYTQFLYFVRVDGRAELPIVKF
jgi:hypothetical protein